MALTATATTASRQFIIKSLCMQSPEIISVSPNRDNIIYSVPEKPKDGAEVYFKNIVSTLKTEIWTEYSYFVDFTITP